MPNPVAVLSVWVCGRWIAGITSSNLAGVMNVLSLVSVVFCEVEISAMGQSLVQRSPTECGASECDLETSTMRRRSPTGATELWL